jgi:peptide/nickel transport system substrate-binding protein
VFSLQRVVKLNKTPGFIITQFGFSPDNVEKSIHALDDYTLELKLPNEAEATSFVLYCLSANVGSVVDMKAVLANQSNGDLGNTWLKTRTAGAGAYKLTEWAASDHVIIDANPNAAQKGNMHRVVMRHVADPAAQLLLLQKGDVDIARELGSDQLRSIAGDKNLTVASSPQGTSMYIAMNQAMPELQKVQVHQAIKWAIDYDAIAKNITPGTWSVCQALLPDALPGALKSNPFRKDVARAKQLLAEAGLPNGFAVTMDYINTSPSSDIAQAIQADLAAIGIKATLQPGEQKQVITKTRARQHQLAMLVWGTDYFDPNSNSQAWCENPDDSDQSKLKILAWRSHFVDKHLTSESQEAVHELDPVKRMALYRTIQQEFMDRAPFAMLLQRHAVAVLGKGVSGFKVGPMADYTPYTTIAKA